MAKYLCPVCGYPELDEPPYLNGQASFEICPCCGYEFGYNDPNPASKETFLRNWVRMGTPWATPSLKPKKWDAKAQLKGIDVDFENLIE